MTVVFCTFLVSAGIFMAVAVTFGNVDGGVGFYVVLYVAVASFFAFAWIAVGHGSFFVAPGQVRSGLPRSRWIRSGTVEAVRADQNRGLNFFAVVRQHNGSERSAAAKPISRPIAPRFQDLR